MVGEEGTEHNQSHSVNAPIPETDVPPMSFDATPTLSSRPFENASRTAGLEFVDLSIVKPDPDAVDLAPGDFALKNQVLPMGIDNGVLYVAVGNASSLAAVDDLGILL